MNIMVFGMCGFVVWLKSDLLDSGISGLLGPHLQRCSKILLYTHKYLLKVFYFVMVHYHVMNIPCWKSKQNKVLCQRIEGFVQIVNPGL
jgi:hypothetical protein